MTRRSHTVPALLVDALRVAASLLLAYHFAREARGARDIALIHDLWPSPPAHAATAFSGLSAALRPFGVHGARSVFVAGVALSLFAAAGVAPRVCSALLLAVAAVASQIVAPAVTIDEFFAEALPFWLLLLPTGRTLTVVDARRYAAWGSERVEAWSLRAALAFFALLFLGLALAGPLPALDDAPLACGAAALLCGVLLLAFVVDRTDRGTGGPRRAPIGVAAAVGSCAAVTLAVQGLAASAGAAHVEQAAGGMLANAGLSWSWEDPLEAPAGAALDVAFRPEGSHEHRGEGFDSRDRRLQALLRVLLAPPPASAKQSLVVRGLVERHCGRAPLLDRPPVREYLVALVDGRPTRTAARFQCGEAGAPAKVSLPTN